MSEITDYLKGYLNELDNYMNRLNTNRLSRKDRKLFLEMSNEYYEFFQQHYEADHNAFPEALFGVIENFNDNIANQDKDAVSLANEYYKKITDIAGKFRDTVERIELLSGVFQKDVAAFNLHDEKIAMLQDLVDLDQRMQGKISQETLRVLEVQHCEVVDGRVIEMQEQKPIQQQIEELGQENESAANRGQDRTQEREEMEVKKSNVTTIKGKEYRVLTDAELDQAIADQARTPKRQRKTLDLSDCYIENYVFKGDMDYISFAGSHFANCEFRMTKSDHVSFENAVLDHCNLNQSDFSYCSFKSAVLEQTKMNYNLVSECSFDQAVLDHVRMDSCNFYKTSFQNVHMNSLPIVESGINENIFFRCNTDTVTLELPDVSLDEANSHAQERMRDMFNNEGYSYQVIFTDWQQPDRFQQDIENGETKFTVKIFEGENQKTFEELQCTAKIDPDTFEILDVDSGKAFDRKTAKMFASEISNFVPAKTRMNLHFPSMQREAFIELTKQLKAYGAKFDTANKQWYIMPDNSNIEFFRQYLSERKQGQKNAEEKNASDFIKSDVTPEQFGLDGKAAYRAYAYMKGNNQKPKPVYGKNPEEIVAKLQTWNNGRTDAMKLHTCYIQKLNSDTNKFENIGKWDLLSGKDITPIYLTLPHFDNRSEFNQVIAELKAAGAKYNYAKKAFYITKQDDLNKFAEYLPFAGTRNEIRDNGSKAERNFTIEPGREYYDNRVQVTIEGMKPVQIYGDDYDVHFPSMSVDETRDIIEKYVLPELQSNHPEKELPSEMEYNGKMYDPLQYDVLKLAERQKFTEEQMSLLERQDLSSDRMNEIRFAIRDGLSPEQIAQFATPAYEQWQMDLCRIGLQHGFTMQDIQPLINPEGYTQDKWGERRNHLQKMIHEKDRANKKSLISRLDNNKEKVSSSQQNKAVVEKNEQKKALPDNVLV